MQTCKVHTYNKKKEKTLLHLIACTAILFFLLETKDQVSSTTAFFTGQEIAK